MRTVMGSILRTELVVLQFSPILLSVALCRHLRLYTLRILDLPEPSFTTYRDSQHYCGQEGVVFSLSLCILNS